MVWSQENGLSGGVVEPLEDVAPAPGDPDLGDLHAQGFIESQLGLASLPVKMGILNSLELMECCFKVEFKAP